MKIAFIGHSYHSHTRSNTFFVELLRKLASVEIFYDETWRGDPSLGQGPGKDFDATLFDCVVIWQVRYPFEWIREPHPNLVFVPMYDDLIGEGGVTWLDAFNPAKIVCFSAALHRLISAHTSRSVHFKYFPDPRRYPAAPPDSILRGIFWKRVCAIDETVIARLCGDAVFDTFTLHDAPDPLSGAALIQDPPIPARQIQRTVWNDAWTEYLHNVAAHNIFFAPRPAEGIGMSFLEAMAMGLCVVAPDTPTHNEYIAHEETGLLYDVSNPQPLDFSCAAEIGARARQSIEEGFAKWSAAQDDLLNFIVVPALTSPCSA